MSDFDPKRDYLLPIDEFSARLLGEDAPLALTEMFKQAKKGFAVVPTDQIALGLCTQAQAGLVLIGATERWPEFDRIQPPATQTDYSQELKTTLNILDIVYNFYISKKDTSEFRADIDHYLLVTSNLPTARLVGALALYNSGEKLKEIGQNKASENINRFFVENKALKDELSSTMDNRSYTLENQADRYRTAMHLKPGNSPGNKPGLH